MVLINGKSFFESQRHHRLIYLVSLGIKIWLIMFLSLKNQLRMTGMLASCYKPNYCYILFQ